MFVVGALVGAGATYAAGNVAQLGYDKGFAAGAEKATADAMQRLADNAATTRPQVTVMTIGGSVIAVSGSSFTMRAPSVSGNPLDPTPETRTVRIDATTRIIVAERKADDVYEKEFAAYEAAYAAWRESAGANEDAGQPPDRPDMVSVRDGSIADVVADVAVEVTAATDIARAEEFTATEVRVGLGSEYTATIQPPPAETVQPNPAPPTITAPTTTPGNESGPAARPTPTDDGNRPAPVPVTE